MKKPTIPNGSIVVVNQSGLYLVWNDHLIALFCRRVGQTFRYWRYEIRKDQKIEVVGSADFVPAATIAHTQWPQYTEFVAQTWIKYDFSLQNRE